MKISKLRTVGQQLGLLLLCALMATRFDPANAQDAEFHTKVYSVPMAYTGTVAADPFAGPEAPVRRTAKEILTEAGVTFGPGTSAIHNPGTSQVIVRNTKEQMELVDAYFESILGKAEKQLRIKVEWFGLSHQDFSELMEKEDHEHAGEKRSSNDGALRDKVVAMVKGDKATVIDTAMIVARSGQRAKVESVMEVIYPTKYLRSKAEVTEVDAKEKKAEVNEAGDRASLLPVADAYKTRNVGTTLEVDPVLGADEYTVDLSLSPEIVYFAGNEDYGVYSDGESEVVARTPVFYTVKATTQATMIAGEYLLFAATSPINEEKGVMDKSRKVMVFVKTDILYVGLPVKK